MGGRLEWAISYGALGSHLMMCISYRSNVQTSFYSKATLQQSSKSSSRTNQLRLPSGAPGPPENRSRGPTQDTRDSLSWVVRPDPRIGQWKLLGQDYFTLEESLRTGTQHAGSIITVNCADEVVTSNNYVLLDRQRAIRFRPNWISSLLSCGC